jgi:hypothetical protein
MTNKKDKQKFIKIDDLVIKEMKIRKNEIESSKVTLIDGNEVFRKIELKETKDKDVISELLNDSDLEDF